MLPIVFVIAGVLAAQTRIDIADQARNLPAAGAPAENPCSPAAERVDAKTLRIGARWTALRPCDLSTPGYIVKLASPATVTLPELKPDPFGRTIHGDLYLYVSRKGEVLTLTVGSLHEVSCSNCAVTTAQQFPYDSKPLAVWGIDANGQLEPSGLQLAQLGLYLQSRVGVKWQGSALILFSEEAPTLIDAPAIVTKTCSTPGEHFYTPDRHYRCIFIRKLWEQDGILYRWAWTQFNVAQ